MSSDNEQTISDLYAANMRLQEDRDKWRNACLRISEIIKIENRSPRGSEQRIEKLQHEWPLLWDALWGVTELR